MQKTCVIFISSVLKMLLLLKAFVGKTFLKIPENHKAFLSHIALFFYGMYKDVLSINMPFHCFKLYYHLMINKQSDYMYNFADKSINEGLTKFIMAIFPYNAKVHFLIILCTYHT